MVAAVSLSEKASRLVAEGKVRKEVDTDRRAHYAVEGETETHSVIFDKAKNKWSCECRFSALLRKECSHIIACRLLDERLKK